MHGAAPTPAQVGVSLALEAHRLGFLDDALLQRVLGHYAGATSPEPPDVVLRRLGRLSDAQLRRVLEAGRATALPGVLDVGRPLGSRLTLFEPLGSGAMGTVHRAHDRLLNREVAVKLVRLEGDDPERRALRLQRFQREAQVMARVTHPAVVPIHDAGVSEQGEPYLVMELVRGESLARRIGAGAPLDPARVARWGAALAEGLQACHDAGVVHRDVKPANVLLGPADDPRLTDFGVAQDHAAGARLTTEQAAVGTLAYMAPEQLAGGTTDARTDVYALGATLFEALTGRLVFDAPHPVALMRLIMEAPAPPVRSLRADCPARLEAIVQRCLAKAPGDRYPNAALLAHDLGAVARDRDQPAPSARRRRARARRPVWLAAATFAVAGAALLAAGTRGGRTPEVGPIAGVRSADAPASISATPTLVDVPAPGPGRPREPSRLVTRAGEVTNERDGSILVWVPPGEYLIGSDTGEEEERPLRRIVVERGYYVGKFEVTIGQFARFCAETGRAAPSRELEWEGQRFALSEAHPALQVTWELADAYCSWAGVRLPTEVEWECAARGQDGRRWPWGNQVPRDGRQLANLNDSTFFAAATAPHRALWSANATKDYDDGAVCPWPVGAAPRGASPCGAQDMAGNVDEWCAGEEVRSGAYGGVALRPKRGSGWNFNLWSARCSARGLVPATHEGGLRVCRDDD